jgi:hypothetical protein
VEQARAQTDAAHVLAQPRVFELVVRAAAARQIDVQHAAGETVQG